MDAELITRLESALDMQDSLQAGRVLLGMLADFEKGSTPYLPEEVASRLAYAVERLLGNPDIPISKTLFLNLNRFKRSLVHIFQISDCGGTSHLAGMAENWSKDFRRGEGALRLFTGLSINAMGSDRCEAFLRLNPQWSFPIMLGLLSEQFVYTAQGEEARSRILGAGGLWDGIDPDFYGACKAGCDFPLSLSAAYMGCSYAEAPHKHEIKRCMNKVVRRWLGKNGIDDDVAGNRVSGRRPHLVVFAELYSPFHAMHRCYGPSMEALKEDFDTTLVLANTALHPEFEKLAHRVETVAVPENNPLELIARLRALEPDVLYLPSVGMRFPGIAVANARIAPIQIRSQGHPATTHSDRMDYAIQDVDHRSEGLSSERIVFTGVRMVFARRPDAMRVEPNLRANPDLVRFAVPAWCRKVTPRFLETCRRIREQAKGKVEFRFFPNVSGVLCQAFRKIVNATLPGSMVVPSKEYNAHIRDLNECDIFLSTFPFGSTNGIIDAVLQGLPVVNLEGDEAHSRIDAVMAAMVGQPAWLTACSVDEYVNAAVRLVDEPGLRMEIGRKILEAGPEKIFYSVRGSSGLADAIRFIWQNHDAIQASEQRRWECTVST